MISQFPTVVMDALNRQQRAEDATFKAYRTVSSENKGNSDQVVEPIGRWCSMDEGLLGFLRIRNLLIEYVRNSDKDFRRNVTPRKFGKAEIRDLHQLLTLTAAHTLRHTGQIQVVKMHQDFPSEK